MPRVIPRAVAARVARKHQAFYRAISEAVDRHLGRAGHPRDGAAGRRQRAADLGLQDNQVALDGLTNGLFTGKLLETWGAGAFQGDYAGFHKAIVDLMPPTQTPNHYAPAS